MSSMPDEIRKTMDQASLDTFEALRVHFKNPEFSKAAVLGLLWMDYKLIYTLVRDHIKNKDKKNDETLRR